MTPTATEPAPAIEPGTPIASIVTVPITPAGIADRAPSIGTIMKFCGYAVVAAGAVYAAGTRSGSGSEIEAAMASKILALTEVVRSNGDRIRAVEDYRATLGPSVTILSKATDDLTKSVNEMRTILAGQTVEIRLLHESVIEQRSKPR